MRFLRQSGASRVIKDVDRVVVNAISVPLTLGLLFSLAPDALSGDVLDGVALTRLAEHVELTVGERAVIDDGFENVVRDPAPASMQLSDDISYPFWPGRLAHESAHAKPERATEGA